MSTDRTTEILNYLSAISREVGAFRTEMNTFRADVETFRAETQTRLDRLEGEVREVRTDVAAIRVDIRTLKSRFDRYASHIYDIRGRQRELEERVGVLDGKEPTEEL